MRPYPWDEPVTAEPAWLDILEARTRADAVISRAVTELLLRIARHPLPAGWSWEFAADPVVFDDPGRFTITAVPVQHKTKGPGR
jgi:hypothetical protein